MSLLWPLQLDYRPQLSTYELQNSSGVPECLLAKASLSKDGAGIQYSAVSIPGLRDFSMKLSEAHKKSVLCHSPKKSTDGNSILLWELTNSIVFPAACAASHLH